MYFSGPFIPWGTAWQSLDLAIVSGAAGWCGRLQASLWYSDFIALGHVLVGGTSGSYGGCIFKVVSVLFSIILLVFL